MRNLSSDVWYIVSGIRHISEIRHLTSAYIRRLTSDTRYISDIRLLVTSAYIRHLTADIIHISHIRHLTSDLLTYFTNQTSDICNVSSDIWYIISGTIHISEIRCLTSAYIRRLTSDTRYISDIRRLVTSAYIRHLTADIGHQTSYIFYTSDVWHLTSWHQASDIC